MTALETPCAAAHAIHHEPDGNRHGFALHDDLRLNLLLGAVLAAVVFGVASLFADPAGFDAVRRQVVEPGTGPVAMLLAMAVLPTLLALSNTPPGR